MQSTVSEYKDYEKWSVCLSIFLFRYHRNISLNRNIFVLSESNCYSHKLLIVYNI
jgi:hypothetical protein